MAGMRVNSADVASVNEVSYDLGDEDLVGGLFAHCVAYVDRYPEENQGSGFDNEISNCRIQAQYRHYLSPIWQSTDNE
jgi:hypothetical protein